MLCCPNAGFFFERHPAPPQAPAEDREPMENTLILLKPDCVQRRLIGRIISRFEDKALTIVAMKLIQVTPELAKQHYAEHVDKPFYPGLEEFITGAPVVAMVLEGLDVQNGPWSWLSQKWYQMRFWM